MSKITRRQMLQLLGLATGGAGLAWLARYQKALRALAQGQDSHTYLPFIANGKKATSTATITRTPTRTATPGTPTPPGALTGRVVHVRAADATDWNGTTMFYEHVNQTTVNTMVFNGLVALTGKSNWGDIWHTLFSRVHAGGYSEGQKIAIKVNFNNSDRTPNTCSSHNNLIDALPHPIVGLLAGLNAAGVPNSAITVYDATGNVGRSIPSYFRDAISGISYVGKVGCGVPGVSYGKHSSLTVSFPGTTLKNRLLPDVLYDATYLINMPILKAHGGPSVTLGFKNHFGSINYVYASGDDNLHQYIDTPPTGGSPYSANYSPYIPIYQNPNIGPKTILMLGDGLFGGFGSTVAAAFSWDIFGGKAANSLFFATDPVAIDCVMADLLRAEGQATTEYTYDYLFCAEQAGLGQCEGTRANPGGNPLQTPYGSGYSGAANGGITYVRQDLS